MSLKNKLSQPPPRQPTKVGKSITAWVATLPLEDQDAVLKAATDPAWGHTALLETLVEAGMPPTTDNTLRSWRAARGWQNK